MLGGVNLSLMIGPAVPVPVPQAILDALVEVQVVTTAGETASGFELTFDLSKDSPLQTIFLLSGGASLPLVRVILTATVNGTPEVLIDGMMTQHETTEGSKPGMFGFKIKGKDLTTVMDYIDFSGIPYPAMPEFARVALILAKYAVFGIIPLVIPPILLDVEIPIQRIPIQHGKDLPYIRQLADQVGYTFYLEPGPAPGVSIAYWGPEIRTDPPQPSLNLDMDAATNVESIRFTFNNEERTLPVLFIHEPITHATIPIPIPNISLLKPPLGLIPPIPKRIEPLRDTSHLSPIAAALRGMNAASRSSDSVSGTGSLDVLRYGRVLKARRLVGVRGAGTAFDGLYFVKSVTHRISRGGYKQNFTLVRDGLVSTVPAVPA